jgi:hypothetical protein
MPRADAIHLGLMLLALAVAYVLPFELLLLSYAILGPVHYLTEISWLHDRKYFLAVTSPRPAFAFVALMAVLTAAAVAVPSIPVSGLLIWTAFVVGALAVARVTLAQRVLMLALVGGFTLALASQSTFIALTAVLLPTLIHVSVFTLVFMMVGAHRAGSWTQGMLVLAYLAALALILAVPPAPQPMVPALAMLGWRFFGGVPPALAQVLHLPGVQFDSRLTGLLSFVYTYHYVNWFIKADVIGWRRVPGRRLAAVYILGVAATGLYFYDYALGFTVLLSLSLMHVVLEFPLNALSLRQLAGIAAQGVMRRQPA